MAKVKNITELRDFGLEILEKLAENKIDTTEAGVSGKIIETVISSIKTQIEYHRLLGQEPEIPFMSQGVNQKLISGSGVALKKIDYSKK